MRNTSFSPLCAAFLLLMLLSPLAAGAAQPQKPVSSPLTITVQEAEPGQMLLLGSSPEDSDLRVGALICRPLAEQAVDRKKTGGGLRLDVPLEWLDGYVAARSGKEDLPFQLWQQGEQWTSSLPIRLHDACAAAPMSRLTERWQAVREKLSRQKLSQPCRTFRRQGDNWLPLVLWWDGYQAFKEDRPYRPLELGNMAAQSDALQAAEKGPGTACGPQGGPCGPLTGMMSGPAPRAAGRLLISVQTNAPQESHAQALSRHGGPARTRQVPSGPAHLRRPGG